MNLFDHRGHLLGRINIVDLAVSAALFIVILLAIMGYALFRTPAVPRIDRVEPSVVVAGTDARITLTGRNFLPFFRVFLEPSGASATLSHRVRADEPHDEFTVSNRARASWMVENPTLAEVWIPPGTLPGTYSVAFYDETRQVTVKQGAVTVEPARFTSVASTASVRAVGAFIGVRADVSHRFAPGTRFTSGSTVLAEVLAAEAPQPAALRLQVGQSFVQGSVSNQLQVPAILRVFCAPTDGRCRVGEDFLGAFVELRLPVERESVRFFVYEITPDVPIDTAHTAVWVRAVVPPETAARLKPGDHEHFAAGVLAPFVPVATLERIEQRAATQSGSVVLDVRLSIPTAVVADAILFRGLPLKIGTPLSFATRDYVFDGTIVRVGNDHTVSTR